MRLTERDLKVIKDIALSHTLSRDSLIRLGYFSSISRCNRRMADLCLAEFVAVHSTPFHGQHLYVAGRRASSVVGDRIAALLSGRQPTPRYLQHSMAVTETRLVLTAQLGGVWRFEQQVWDDVTWGGLQHQVRPDGVLLKPESVTFVEVDLGHVSPARFGQKLGGYRAYLVSGRFSEVYGAPTFALCVVTTTARRVRALREVSSASFATNVQTFESLGIRLVGGWS